MFIIYIRWDQNLVELNEVHDKIEYWNSSENIDFVYMENVY